MTEDPKNASHKVNPTAFCMCNGIRYQVLFVYDNGMRYSTAMVKRLDEEADRDG